MVGKSPGSVLQGKETCPYAVQRISDAIEKQNNIESTILNYHKNGTPYWIDMIITPILDEDDHLNCYIAVERDITKKIQLEKKLEQSVERANVANDAKSTFWQP